MSINSAKDALEHSKDHRHYDKDAAPDVPEQHKSQHGIDYKKVRDFESDEAVRHAKELTPETEEEELVDLWLNDGVDDDVIEFNKPAKGKIPRY